MIFLDMMSRCYVYLLLLDRARSVWGSVEHLEGKGGESVVAIPMFLCGSLSHPKIPNFGM
jgi:hypothetical protein